MAKLEKFVDLQGNQREMEPVKRTRAFRPRDPEAEAIATITQAEMKRNEAISRAKVTYDAKVEIAEDGFKERMQEVLASLDDVTRTRVAHWVESRYGKA